MKPEIKIILGLSSKELTVFNVIEKYKHAQNAASIAREADLPISTVYKILIRFEKRTLVERTVKFTRPGKKPAQQIRWMYRRKLESLHFPSLREKMKAFKNNDRELLDRWGLI